MREYSAARVEKLANENLSGYILKSDSPSCGMLLVRVFGADETPSRDGRGLFAEALPARFPHLPVEEEGRLCEPQLRENWIERVLAYRRLRTLWESRWTSDDLAAFHAAHKLTLASHSPKAFQELGRLVAGALQMPRAELQDRYHDAFMSALRLPATRGKHANVLQHMAGCFNKQVDAASQQELAESIRDYRQGRLPLIVPLTLIKHHVRAYRIRVISFQ